MGGGVAIGEDLTAGERAVYASGRWLTEDARDWITRALCRRLEGAAELFHAHPGTPAEAEAVELCGRCPVILECRAYGDAVETLSTTYGTLGGETERERRARRRRELVRP